MAVRTMQLKISDVEYSQRCTRLVECCREKDLDGITLFGHSYILYYTGFAFIPTERPIALLINRDGEVRMFVPELEHKHAAAHALVDDVTTYPEYPGTRHPMQFLKDTLSNMKMKNSIGIDHDGYPLILGYRGTPLSKLTEAELVHVNECIEDQMMIKSEKEIELIRESVRWGNLAHTLLQRYTAVGASETEVSQKASNEASGALLDALGPIYRAQSLFFETAAGAGYRGQIGRNSEIPHALANNITFQRGDLLVTGASSVVWGYLSELERTMVLGEPSSAQKKYFTHLMNLQDIAFEAIKAGIPCSDVDNKVSDYYKKSELMPFKKHHTGHAIGLRYHEGPFLDPGDSTIIKPGMVFTVEPGLYVPDLGGFRHSDTVLVTVDGIEILTYYPRDLESLTIL